MLPPGTQRASSPRARTFLSMPMMSPASVTSRTGVVSRPSSMRTPLMPTENSPQIGLAPGVHADGVGDEHAVLEAGDDVGERRGGPAMIRLVGRTPGMPA